MERVSKFGVEAKKTGPTSADAAQQVRDIEYLIAKGVDVIGVVSKDETALKPVMEKAKYAGIVVITYEGPGLNNFDWNFQLAYAKGLV